MRDRDSQNGTSLIAHFQRDSGSALLLSCRRSSARLSSDELQYPRTTPRIKDTRSHFAWQIDPPTTLYHAPRFTLRFPPTIDPAHVSSSVWWRVALICLHSQWPLLRPCEVRLPVTLPRGEAETWLRLTDIAVATLEAYRNQGTGSHERAVSIVEDGPLLTDVPLADTSRCDRFLAGAKDSMVRRLAVDTDETAVARPSLPMPRDRITSRGDDDLF